MNLCLLSNLGLRCLIVGVLIAVPLICQSQDSEPTKGLIHRAEGYSGGYTLIPPVNDRLTYLVDSNGEVVHNWKSYFYPGRTAYLLEDGSILRTGQARPARKFRNVDQGGGHIERIAWDGTIMWSYTFNSATEMAHHDIAPLPNGNLLVLGWQWLSARKASERGRDLEKIDPDGVWIETVTELRPSGRAQAEVVWRWSALDHLVQNRSEEAPGFGDPKENPTRIDFNYVLRSEPNWINASSIDYLEEHDQILLSAEGFGEIWIIDRASGDIVFRWGNPQAWSSGDENARRLFAPKDARWLPGGKGILVTDRRKNQEGDDSSIVFELNVQRPLDQETISSSDVRWKLDSELDTLPLRGLSGAQRLLNGNTLICTEQTGTLLEFSPKGDLVWHYINPFGFFERTRYPADSSPEIQALIARLEDEIENEGKENSKDRETAEKESGTHAVFRAVRYPADYPGILLKR